MKRMVVIRRGLALHVDFCPIRARIWRGKPYANVIHNCSSCSHLAENGVANKAYAASDPDITPEKRAELLKHPEPEGFLVCSAS